jgi:hypothetical protein
MGDCHQCGANILPIFPKESLHFDEWLVSWRCFQQEIIGLGEDGNLKRGLNSASWRHQLPHS